MPFQIRAGKVRNEKIIKIKEMRKMLSSALYRHPHFRRTGHEMETRRRSHQLNFSVKRRAEFILEKGADLLRMPERLQQIHKYTSNPKP